MSRMRQEENNGSPPRLMWCEERRYAVRGAPRGGRGLRTRICIDMGSQCGGFLEGGVGASANLRVCGGVAGCLWLGCTAPRWRCRFFP